MTSDANDTGKKRKAEDADVDVDEVRERALQMPAETKDAILLELLKIPAN